MSEARGVSSRLLVLYETCLRVRDPNSSFDQMRTWYVAADDGDDVAALAQADFERRCAPLRVQEVVSIEKADDDE